MPLITLVTTSPRRAQYLKSLGVHFDEMAIGPDSLRGRSLNAVILDRGVSSEVLNVLQLASVTNRDLVILPVCAGPRVLNDALRAIEGEPS